MSELVFGCVVVTMMIGTTEQAAGLQVSSRTSHSFMWSMTRQYFSQYYTNVHYCVLTCIDCGMFSHTHTHRASSSWYVGRASCLEGSWRLQYQGSSYGQVAVILTMMV